MEVDFITVEAYVTKFLAKCVDVVLGSRLVESKAKKNPQLDKWFQFCIPEMLENNRVLSEWKENIHQPLILKFYLNYPRSSEDMSTTIVRVLLESWCIDYQSMDPESNPELDKEEDLTSLYKRMTVLTRVLYSQSRLLPASQLYQALKENQKCSFFLDYELTTILAGETEPLEEKKQVFALSVPTGCVSVCVKFNPFRGLINSLYKADLEQEVKNDHSEEWIVPKTEVAAVQCFHPSKNPVTAHFRNSFQFMKSAMTSFFSSAPHAQQAPVHKESTQKISRDEDIMEFLKEIQEAAPLNCNPPSTVNLTSSMRRELLDKYR